MNIITKYSIAFLSLCLILFASVSCTDHDKIDAGLVAFPSALTVDYHGLTADEKKEISFTITSNADWKIASDVDWITPSHESGAETRVIFLKVGVNETGEDRTGTVVVTANGSTQEVIVTQKKKVDNLTAQPAEITVYSTGKVDMKKNPTISIATNSPWEATCDVDWIKMDQISGEQEFPVITLEIGKHEDSEREGTITIVSGSETTKVKVTQILPRLIVNTAPLFVNKLGLDMESAYPTIEVIADKEWTITTTDSWIVPEKVSEDIYEGIVLAAKDNATGITRSGKVTITSGSLSSEVVLSQSKREVVLVDDEKPVSTLYLSEYFDWITSAYVNSDGIPLPDFFADYEQGASVTTANALGVGANSQLKKDWDKAGWTPYIVPSVSVSVYFVAGALKFGTSARGGGIISPTFGIEEGKYSNLKVTFNVATHIVVSDKEPSSPSYGTGTPDNQSITLIITGPGTFDDGTTSKDINVDNKKWDDRQTKTVVVKDAGSDTQLIFASTKMANNTGRSRWYLDDVKVVKESKVDFQ